MHLNQASQAQNYKLNIRCTPNETMIQTRPKRKPKSQIQNTKSNQMASASSLFNFIALICFVKVSLFVLLCGFDQERAREQWFFTSKLDRRLEITRFLWGSTNLRMKSSSSMASQKIFGNLSVSPFYKIFNCFYKFISFWV